MNLENAVTKPPLWAPEWAWKGPSPIVSLSHILRYHTYHFVSETRFLEKSGSHYSDFWKDVLFCATILIVLSEGHMDRKEQVGEIKSA